MSTPVTDTQIRAWRYGYREFLPEGPLEQMTGPAAEKMWLRQWDEAIVAPPTPAAPGAGGGGARSSTPRPSPRSARAARGPWPRGGGERVVGLASHAPAEDPDLDPDTSRPSC